MTSKKDDEHLKEEIDYDEFLNSIKDLIKNRKSVQKSKDITSDWSNFLNRLNQSKSSDLNYENFLNWQVIRDTMFVCNSNFHSIELNYLKKTDDWKRWESAIKESSIGNPKRSNIYPDSSENLVHHAYHLSFFENSTNIKINEFDTVLEFGGGYGSMCRLFRNLNYNKDYYIYDIPEFLDLQKNYLDKLNFNCNYFSGDDLNKFKFKGKKLFVATWSLSESPKSLMDNILKKVKNFDAFLICFHKDYANNDNVKYFNDFALKNDHLFFSLTPISFLPDNYYFIGKKK